MDKKILITLSAIVVLTAGAYLLFASDEQVAVSSFEECVEAGYPVMESHPRQCSAPDGQTFTEDIGNELEKIDLVRLDDPRPNQVVQSPLTVTGEARGFWFFEADFPVFLYDADGTEIALGIATAQEEWMTEEFVPFTATLTFNTPATDSGTLVLAKDNPSGLPEQHDELRIPVKFNVLSESGKVSVSGGCVITGCSGQVCAEEEVITTCEWREEYACYQAATCERQTNGECGWTATDELTTCLNNAL